MRDLKPENLSEQREVLQQELQLNRQEIIQQLTYNNKSPDDFPRSVTMALLIGQPGVALLGNISENRLAARHPYILAIGQFMLFMLRR